MLAGAELVQRDVKTATFVEIAALLILLPAASIFFGLLLPRVLEKIARPGRLSFEWIGGGLALAFPLWRRGNPPIRSFGFGVVLAALVAVAIIRFRSSPRARRLLTRTGRRDVFIVFFTGVAWELARLAGPNPAPRLSSDVLTDVAAVGFLAAVLVGLIARWRRDRGSAWREIAAAAWIPLGLSSVALLAWRLAPPLLFLGLAGPALSPWIPPFRRRRLILPAAGMFVLAAAVNIYYQPSSRVDLFEDGHSLAFAHEYLRGATPFLDTYPVHGLGMDGGADYLAFRLMGANLGTSGLRRAIFTAASLTLLAGLSVATLDGPVWGGLGFLLALSICPFVSERTLVAYAALLVLVMGLRRKSGRLILVAGALAGLAIFFALDWGVIVLLGGTAGLLLAGVVMRRWKPMFNFVEGALLSIVPLLLLLMKARALAPFLNASFVELPRSILQTWGLPVPSIAGGIRAQRTLDSWIASAASPPAPAEILLFGLVVACTVLGWKLVSGGTPDLRIVCLIAVSAFALRGMFGRADGGHIELYGALVGIPGAWLVRLAIRSRRAALVLFSLAPLVLILHPLQTVDMELSAVTASAHARADHAAGAARSVAAGGEVLPRDQAEVLDRLRAYMDQVLPPGDTFFDFSNSPALYFFMDRRMPIPFLASPFYETEAAQQAVITRLSERQPGLALLPRAGKDREFDGVPNDVRAPRVAEYIARNYVDTMTIGPYEVWKRAASGTAVRR